MNIRPLGDNIIVQRTQEKGVSSGGIIIPEMAREKPVSGKVLGVGKGAWGADGKRIPMPVKLGDEVMFPPNAGSEVDTPAGKLRLIKPDDILGIIS